MNWLQDWRAINNMDHPIIASIELPFFVLVSDFQVELLPRNLRGGFQEEVTGPASSCNILKGMQGI